VVGVAVLVALARVELMIRFERAQLKRRLLRCHQRDISARLRLRDRRHDCLQKPFDTKTLEVRVAELLGRLQALKSGEPLL
jgi:hypothetical protein